MNLNVIREKNYVQTVPDLEFFFTKNIVKSYKFSDSPSPRYAVLCIIQDLILYQSLD